MIEQETIPASRLLKPLMPLRKMSSSERAALETILREREQAKASAEAMEREQEAKRRQKAQTVNALVEIGLFAALEIAKHWVNGIAEKSKDAEDYIAFAKSEDMRLFGYLPFSDEVYREQYEYSKV